MVVINRKKTPRIYLLLTDLTLVMCADLLFAVKNMKSKTIAMMIIIWESRTIIVEKNIMKTTVCCQETGEDIC